MKNYLLILSAIFISTIAHSIAQGKTTEKGAFSIGLKGGANFSTLNANPEGDIVGGAVRWEDVDKTMSTNFNAGIILNYAVNSIFSLQPELLYSRTGVKYDYNNGGYVAHITDQFNYIQVPLLAKFSFGSDDVKFNIHAGPYFSFATGGTRKADYSWNVFGANITDNQTYNLEVKKGGIQGTDIGAAVGIGVGFAAGPGSIFVEGRYNYGFSNVYNKDNNTNSSSGDNNNLFEGLYPDNTLTNGVINLNLGYLIAIGK